MMKNGEKINILLVDDLPANITALKAVLDYDEYQLFAAGSGEEALKYVLKYDFAVILLDVQMPGLNGYETARIIKQRKSSSHIPIVFITALSQTVEHVSQGYTSGAIDYIFKPYSPDILRSKVEAFVQLYKSKKEVEEQKKHLEAQYNNLEKIVDQKTKELREANEELRLSYNQFEKIFQSSPNLMAIRSVEDGRIISVNSSWCKQTGYDLTEVIGDSSNILKIEASEGEKILTYDFNKLFGLREPVKNLRITFITKGNEKRDGLLSTELLVINGESCIISAITDVTDRVEMEKEIFRLDRLNMVGEMAAGIAHEIRNPMTTVLGFLQISRDQEKPTPREYIDLMLDELRRANSIITEFLSLAKDKASNKSKKNLNDIIKAMFPLLHAEALLGTKGIDLELNECSDLALDEKEIRQMILNIGLNGLEAMPSGGKLTIRTYDENDGVVLAIQDEGSGIKKEIIDKIGTPFFTTKEKGTGLGLAICYSVASRHKAEIEIDTNDTGTTFLIKFKQRAKLEAIK
ncbi:response regulator [Bacillus sp. FJAT-45350]|uniref:response regulator n=1 Tax=Bacillus sp. FJAT-45350 TaxID=2011014 RepID=UPI00211B7869|nr:response regulator [Bacillus sp. FJAT-45350]